MPKNKRQIISIIGPTASGKSDLAVKLAKKFNGEIISADSRQVYKGMDIGTGKITQKEMRGIPHHLLDIASPKRTFTVSQYQKLGNESIKKIFDKGKVPIIVGGTGFYIDALAKGLVFPDVRPDHKLRKRLDKFTAERLFKMLERLDLERAKKIDRHNKRRLARSIEIVKSTKRPVAELISNADYDVLTIGIDVPKEKLAKQIKARLAKRIHKGMIKEVEKLHKQGISWQRLDNFGLEYRWISRYLRGLISKKEMAERLDQDIRNYAKRQMTWFKRDKTTVWVKNYTQALGSVRSYLKNTK